jgi:hypothetical protein
MAVSARLSARVRTRETFLELPQMTDQTRVIGRQGFPFDCKRLAEHGAPGLNLSNRLQVSGKFDHHLGPIAGPAAAGVSEDG